MARPPHTLPGRIEVIELAAPLWSGQPGAKGLAAVDAAVLQVDSSLYRDRARSALGHRR